MEDRIHTRAKSRLSFDNNLPRLVPTAYPLTPCDRDQGRTTTDPHVEGPSLPSGSLYRHQSKGEG